MRIAKSSQSRKSPINMRAQMFSLSTAKTYLGRLTEKASKGEVVYIIQGHKRFILQEVPEIEPIPVRPPGYFSNCYSKTEIQQDNRLAKSSIIRAPRDLE
jgi:hypothetical protein